MDSVTLFIRNKSYRCLYDAVSLTTIITIPIIKKNISHLENLPYSLRLEKALRSSEQQVSRLLPHGEALVADPGSPLLAARKPQSSLELQGSNRELWGALHAPDLPDPDCYFPLLLISYLIMTLPQVCSAEVSLNALHHAKGQRGINQHPQRGSRREGV